MSLKNRYFGSSVAVAYKIHISIYSTRSILQDLRKIHLSESFTEFIRILAQNPYNGILYDKIHGSSARFTSPGPRQDPYLRTHIPISIYANSFQDIYFRIYVSASLSAGPRLRIIYKIHISGSCKYKAETCVSMSQHPYFGVHKQASVFVDPLQDPYLRIY